eukprot:gene8025-9428_t
MITKIFPNSGTTDIDMSELTDIVLTQGQRLDFGRVVRVVDGDGEPFGVVSIINYRTHGKAATVPAIMDYLVDKAKDCETSHLDASKNAGKTVTDRLKSLAQEGGKTGGRKNLGIVLSERFLNVPYQLVPHFHQFLHWDIELLSESKNEFKFDDFIFISSFGVAAEQDDMPNDIQEADTSDQEEYVPQTKKTAGKSGGEAPVKAGEIIYFKPEDKYLKKHASTWFTFNIPYEYGPGARWTFEGGVHRKGLVMVVPASSMNAALKEIKEKLSE